MYPRTINNLIECFKKFPGIGEKTAERLALSYLETTDDTHEMFIKTLNDSKTKIKKCKTCGNITETEICDICNDDTRDKDILCVVEESKNVPLFEKIGAFNGKYHVLGGLISPLDGVNPEDINIENLIDKVKREKIKEIILAVKPTIEGETTSLYIRKLLEGTDVIISKIAHGVPIGADIDYIDPLTLEIALSDRTKIS